MNLISIICRQNIKDKLLDAIHAVDRLPAQFISIGQLPPTAEVKIIKGEIYGMLESLDNLIKKELSEK